MVTSATPFKGRLAPSPTGRLHLGHAFSFIHAYWRIKRLGGTLILRQEDLDIRRSSKEDIEYTKADLRWLGLNWHDERLQSAEETRIIEQALLLQKRALAYYCSCTRGDLKALGAPHGGGEIAYPGTCRDKMLSAKEGNKGTLALRFLVEDKEVSFHDEFQGVFAAYPKAEVGDFPILRKDGSPAYQLAVTVDDAYDGITHVTRGADLLPSTARQILLQQALGFPTPTYSHVPLIGDANGVRLAKRHDSLSIAACREAGVQAQSIIDWVAEVSGLEVTLKSGSGIDAWLSAFESWPGFNQSSNSRQQNEPATDATIKTSPQLLENLRIKRA